MCIQISKPSFEKIEEYKIYLWGDKNVTILKFDMFALRITKNLRNSRQNKIFEYQKNKKILNFLKEFKLYLLVIEIVERFKQACGVNLHKKIVSENNNHLKRMSSRVKYVHKVSV